MLKKISLVLFALMLMLSMAVHAGEATVTNATINPILRVTDAEVRCQIVCIGHSDDTEIEIEVTLVADDEEVASWGDRGTGIVTFYQTCPAEPDQDYEMIVNVTIDGEPMDEMVVRP